MAKSNSMHEKYLHKYRPVSNEQQIKFVEDVILHNKFFFSPSNYFFDPFEFKYKSNGNLENPFVFDSPYKKVGILSLSEENNNIKMWSYYADWHRGICMGFEFKNDCSFFSKAKKVQYLPDYPTDSLLKEYSDNVLLSAIVHKPIIWAHEKEWRIIEIDAGGEYRNFPKGKLKYIILGCMIKQETVNLIKGWIKQLDYKVQLKQTKVSNISYGLDILDLD